MAKEFLKYSGERRMESPKQQFIFDCGRKILMANVFSKYLEKWRMKTPKQKWQFIYNCAGTLGDAAGVTVLTTMKVYWYSYFPDVMSFLYFSTASYTVWFYCKQGEYLRGLQATGAVGIVFACLIVQILTIGPARFRLNNLVNFGGRYIYMDEDQTPKYTVVRKKLIERLVRDTVVVLTLIFAAVSMFGISAIYAIVFNRARITILGIELPFFEENSDIGFLVNLTMQAALAALGIVGIIAIELGVSLVCNAVTAVPHLMHIETEDLGTEIRMNGMSLMARVRLRNIFMKLQDFEKIVQEAIDLYYTRTFVGPYLLAYSISFSIFGQLLLGYPTGYGVAAGNYLLLLICCHLGQSLENAKEELTDEFYNMSWYLLPASSQRKVSSAIHMIQNGSSLTIGPFAKLNMGIVTDFTRSIYKFTMLLYKVFN